MFKFKQGETLRDKVTGFTGIVVGRTDYISGCNRYSLQPKVGDDGKLPDMIIIDEPALERLDVLRVVLDRPGEQPPG
jgi:hypothetical protein